MACDHQIFNGPNDPNTLGLDPTDGLHATEVSAVGANSCVISEWYYDDVTMQWIEACGTNIPVASLSVANFQTFDDVDINFGYIPKSECPTPIQTDGVYTICDNLNNPVASGTGQLAATVNLDFSTFLSVPLSGAEYPQDFTFTVKYYVEDVCGISETVERTIQVSPYFKEVFTFTGTDQTATAPAWAVNAFVKTWGGAGAGYSLDAGGAGGYSEGTMPAQDFLVVVGEGGNRYTTPIASARSYGGGGFTQDDTNNPGGFMRGQGGGLSGVFSAGTAFATATAGDAILIAGGGGMASHQSTLDTTYDPGLAGGGAAGQAAASTVQGQPGTQVSGGAGGTGGASGDGDPGGQFFGGNVIHAGNASVTPGAGGSGWFGGGGGTGWGSLDRNEGGGGGGSGYASGAVTGAVLTAGTDENPPNTGDADYVAGVGQGYDAFAAEAGEGGDGLVVVCWTT